MFSIIVTAAWASFAPTPPPPAAAVGTTQVYEYLRFGGTVNAPEKFNCVKWSQFYAPNGTSAAPGGPQNDATGTKNLVALCTGITGAFKFIGNYATFVQPNYDANGKLAQVAFAWNIASTSAKDGSLIVSPAISTIALTSGGLFSFTQDYFDPSLLPPGMYSNGNGNIAAVQDPAAAEAAAWNYIFFGATKANPLKYDCAKWVTYYSPTGTSAAPGGAGNTATGTAALLGLCKAVVSELNSVAQIESVQPNYDPKGTMIQLAFKYTITGLDPKGGATIVPAISTIQFDANGKFAYTQDYFDPTTLPPGLRRL